MENATLIGQVLGPVYVVVGLSMLLYIKPWMKLMDEYYKNHLAYLPMAMMGMVLGLLVVNTYNVWAWDVYVIVTITGWLALLKGVFYMVAPGSWTKATIDAFRSTSWVAAWGVVVLVAGAFLSYSVYMA